MSNERVNFWGKLIELGSTIRLGCSNQEIASTAKPLREYMVSELVHQLQRALVPLRNQYKAVKNFIALPFDTKCLTASQILFGMPTDIAFWVIAELTSKDAPKLAAAVQILVGAKFFTKKVFHETWLPYLQQIADEKLEAPKIQELIVNHFLVDGKPLDADKIRTTLQENEVVRKEVKRLASHPKFDIDDFACNAAIPQGIRDQIKEQVAERQITPTANKAYTAFIAKQQKQAALLAAIEKLQQAQSRENTTVI